MTVSNDTASQSATVAIPAKKTLNEWQQPGPAAFDFRSDVMTRPTEAMLDAIIHTTLMDDVFGEDPTTNNLEAFVASLTGHEAGLLVMSGTMGNQVALKTHVTQPPCSVLCDTRGHIVNYEAGGVSSLSSAMLIPVMPANDHHLTLQDVQRHIIISDDVHACPTEVISLENTLDGMIMPLEEARKISQFARENNIKIHLDGARLWEAVAAGAGSLQDYTTLFDSVSLCFSKGLGAPIGSMVVGSKTYINRARRVRKMIGGGTRQGGVISAAARVAIRDTFGNSPNSNGGKLKASHDQARRIAAMWQKKGGQLAKPVETNMVWLDLQHAGYTIPQFIELAATEGVQARGGRLVVHYQISEEGVQRLGRVMEKMLPADKSKSAANGASHRH